MEEKLKDLAKMIVNYSINVKPNERVMITYQSVNCDKLVMYLIKEIIARKGIPMTKLTDVVINNYLLENTTLERIDELLKHQEFEVNNIDSFISIRYTINDYESHQVRPEVIRKIGEKMRRVDDIRINKRKWVLLNYPSALDSYKAKMKLDEYYNYALDVMSIDYSKMSKDIKPLKRLMEKTDKVRLTGPNTDITFSIKGMPIIPCTGEKNIPDGEIYTAPVKNSVNGIITYNTPSPYQGSIYSNVSLTFKDGKIIRATCNGDNEKLNKIFDIDEGSRYIGEFSLGLNPKILYPMGDILYDEKILGSIHFTPGRAYKDSYNGNDSSIHWDMVLIQRKDFGGGDIYFDDVLVRKDGIFVLDELKHLNYNN